MEGGLVYILSLVDLMMTITGKPFWATKNLRELNRLAYTFSIEKRHEKPNSTKKWCSNCIMYRGHITGLRLFRKKRIKI